MCVLSDGSALHQNPAAACEPAGGWCYCCKGEESLFNLTPFHQAAVHVLITETVFPSSFCFFLQVLKDVITFVGHRDGAESEDDQ